MNTLPFRSRIGWHNREPDAHNVACCSPKRRASIPLEIMPIKLDGHRRREQSWRGGGPLASTEPTCSHVLTPFIAGDRGTVLFSDCDFLRLADAVELSDAARPGQAVHCIPHDDRPTETTTMDGRLQTVDLHKYWSLLIAFDGALPETWSWLAGRSKRLPSERRRRSVSHAEAPGSSVGGTSTTAIRGLPNAPCSEIAR